MKIIVRTSPSVLKQLRRFSQALALEARPTGQTPAAQFLDEASPLPVLHQPMNVHSLEFGEALFQLNEALLAHEPSVPVQVTIHESAIGRLEVPAA